MRHFSYLNIYAISRRVFTLQFRNNTYLLRSYPYRSSFDTHPIHPRYLPKIKAVGEHALYLSVRPEFPFLLVVILWDPLYIFAFTTRCVVIARDCHERVTDCHLPNWQTVLSGCDDKSVVCYAHTSSISHRNMDSRKKNFTDSIPVCSLSLPVFIIIYHYLLMYY